MQNLAKPTGTNKGLLNLADAQFPTSPMYLYDIYLGGGVKSTNACTSAHLE